MPADPREPRLGTNLGELFQRRPSWSELADADQGLSVGREPPEAAFWNGCQAFRSAPCTRPVRQPLRPKPARLALGSMAQARPARRLFFCRFFIHPRGVARLFPSTLVTRRLAPPAAISLSAR